MNLFTKTLATAAPVRKVRSWNGAWSKQEWRGGIFAQRRRAATFAAGALALAVGYHVMFGHNGLTAFEAKKQEQRALNQQVKTLERENEALRGHVDRLQTDPNAIEHQAREELHYTRPGEVIVTLPPDPPSQTAPSR